MKRIFLSILAAAGLLTACNMSEVESVNRSADLINFTVLNGGMTKAVDVTTANLMAFEVTAFNHGTETSPYIDAVSYTGGNGTFASATPYYWPQGNLDFYAWSQGAATGNQVSKTNYKTFVVTPSGTPANQVDLVFAGKTDIGKANSTDGAIALNFRHAESKVVVKVKNTAPNLKFVISDWKLGFIDDAGTFTYSGQGAGYNGSTDGRIVDGQSDAGALNVSMWSNNTDAAATKSYTNTLASSVNVAANASEALLGGEMIVIPQSVTAASAHASAAEDALVNGSYIGLKLKILNRENDAVIYDNGAGATAWAIWPANFAFEPGKKYTFTVDLCGGGYYEANHDTDADLDPILEGAVISFASVTVDDFSAQSSVSLPNVDPNFTISEFILDGDDLIVEIRTSIDYEGRLELIVDGNKASTDWDEDGIEEYQPADPGQEWEGYWTTDGRCQMACPDVGTIYTEDFWNPYFPFNLNDIHTVTIHQVGDDKYAASDLTYTVEVTKIIPDVPVVIDSSDPEFPYPVMRKTISSGNSTEINWNINPAFSGQTLTFKIWDYDCQSSDYDNPAYSHTALIENGAASFPIGVLSVGKYTVFAEYSGDQSVITGPNHFVSTGSCELVVEN